MSTRISAGVDDCPYFFTFFITLIPIDCKITNFSLYLFVYILVTIIILVNSLVPRMTMNIIFVCATPIN